MGKLSPDEILKRSAAAWTLRDKWRSVLEDAYEMVYAGMNPYSNPGQNPRTMARQFDSTAVGAVVRLGNRLLTEMTPPDQNWVEINAGPILEMKYDKAAIEQLDETLAKVSRMANVVVNSAPAVIARGAAMIDCIMSGMGCILGLDDAEDDIEPFNDQAVSQSEVAIELNGKGRVGGIYRKRKIKIRDIKNIWSDAVIPDAIAAEQSKDKDPEIEVVEATYEGGRGSKVAWHYEVLFVDNGKNPIPMVDRPYDVCPWTIFRWMVLPGLPYGPGPVLLALADIRTANKVMEMILKNAALALAGMYMVRDDGVLNPDNVTITPGGLLSVQSTGGTMGASIAPLTTNREFDVGQIVLNDLRDAIKKQLFDTALPPERATPISATEMIERIRNFNKDLGVGAGNLQTDIIQYVRRRIEMLAKRGMTPPVKIDQYTLKIQINAPLAKAQKMSEVETVVNWYESSAKIAGPQAVGLVADTDKILTYNAKRMGVPAELLRSKAEKDQMQQQIASVMASQASQPAAQQAA